MSAFIEEVEPVATPSRWPAHFDTNVKIYQSFRRGDGNYVGLEREPGVAVGAPARVMDAAICGIMALWPPLLLMTIFVQRQPLCPVATTTLPDFEAWLPAQ